MYFIRHYYNKLPLIASHLKSVNVQGTLLLMNNIYYLSQPDPENFIENILLCKPTLGEWHLLGYSSFGTNTLTNIANQYTYVIWL